MTYSPEILEAFENKNPKAIAWTSLICTEFTTLCPKTGQPDFAKLFINYIADRKMVESKSFKLYLFSFRNHGDFHEDCVQIICRDLFRLMKPNYLEVLGEFTPRGGISIFPFASVSNSKPEFQRLKKERLTNYAPGKYSMKLDRVYC
jgi:7-cyano-7-deazaguanine reductase